MMPDSANPLQLAFDEVMVDAALAQHGAGAASVSHAQHGGAAHDAALAQELPIARVVLDVQAAHLGETFDYYVTERQSASAVPGALVRVRFGAQRVNGVIWQRAMSSVAPQSSLRALERVVSTVPVASAELRRDIALVARAYGGTRANVMRLAIPPRVAWAERLLPPAIPSELSSADAMQESLRARAASSAGQYEEYLRKQYDGALLQLRSALLQRHEFAAFIWDAMPGVSGWMQQCEWIIAQAAALGRQVVCVVPTMRAAQQLWRGLLDEGRMALPMPKQGSRRSHSEYQGGYVTMLGASMPAAERYFTYQCIMRGNVQCVVGTRAAMYAPVHDDAVFVMVDDTAYQNADGMKPYAQARGVLRVRAQAHQGVMVTLAYARSPLSAWEVRQAKPLLAQDLNVNNADANNADTDADTVERAPQGTDGTANTDRNAGIDDVGTDNISSDSAFAAVPQVWGAAQLIAMTSKARAQWAPRVRWLNREALARLADPNMGARIPSFAVQCIDQALREGAVLLVVPPEGQFPALSCRSCHLPARCLSCAGPLAYEARNSKQSQVSQTATLSALPSQQALQRHEALGAPQRVARCQWCGQVATHWHCKHCSGTTWQVVRVGAAGTAEQLRGLFAHVPMTVVTAQHTPTELDYDERQARIIVAPLGAEPLLRAASSAEHAATSPQRYGSYRAVVMVDAWTSIYTQGMNAKVQVLEQWMRAASLAAPASQGGQLLILGEADSRVAQSLMTWNPAVLANAELAERRDAALPPYVASAMLWGDKRAVMTALDRLGALHGDMATMLCLTSAGQHEEVPSVLGPVAMNAAQSQHLMLEGFAQSVKAIVRVEPERRSLLVERLAAVCAQHELARNAGELHVQCDPPDM